MGRVFCYEEELGRGQGVKFLLLNTVVIGRLKEERFAS